MNAYTYEELFVGQEVRFRGAVTPEDMERFRLLTGDDNPLHRDREFARSRGMEDRVVYGMLTAGFLSTAAGMYLPGENSLIHQVEVKFLRPLLLEHSGALDIHARVTDKDDRFRRITLKVTITDSRGEKVLRAVMQVGVTQ